MEKWRREYFEWSELLKGEERRLNFVSIIIIIMYINYYYSIHYNLKKKIIYIIIVYLAIVSAILYNYNYYNNYSTHYLQLVHNNNYIVFMVTVTNVQ